MDARSPPLLRDLHGPGLAALACGVVGIGWGPALYAQFGDDLLLRVVWSALTLLALSRRDAERDLALVLVAGFGGLVIEAWGTTSGLWHYYTDERPPPWIVPAWPVAALATERVARMVGPRLPDRGWVARVVLVAFAVAMGRFLWPTVHVWSSVLVLVLMAGVCLTVTRPRRDLALFAAGSAVGLVLEYWGTTRGCWTYYTGQQPPLIAAFAHGFASVAFARGVGAVRRVDLRAWLGAQLAGCVATGVGTADPHNVLIVVADDFGVDKWSRYGAFPDQPELPTLDALAVRGTTYTRAWAHPVCSPSRAAILTGRHARRHGIGDALNTGSVELSLDAALLPEVLRDHSPVPYEAHAIGKWHLAAPGGPSGIDHPTLQGFDSFAGSFGNLDSYERWARIESGRTEQTTAYPTTDSVDTALARIEEAGAPWLVYLAFHAPHLPLHAPPGRTATTDLDRHTAMLEVMDAELGRLLDTLHPDVLDALTVIFIGDNGTEGVAVTDPFDPERAKVTVYEGGVHVPLVVAGPRVAAPGGTCDALVADVDVFATVLQVAGVDPASQPMDGLGLLGCEGRDTLITERLAPAGPPPYRWEHVAARGERFKVVWHQRVGADRTEELYDLQSGVDSADLLAAGTPLSVEAHTARRNLQDALQAHVELPYEGR